jgi:hypothetical protein
LLRPATSFVVSYNARESYENSLAEHWAVAHAIRRRPLGEAERTMRLLLKGTARDLAPAFPHIKAQARGHRRQNTRRQRGCASQGKIGVKGGRERSS